MDIELVVVVTLGTRLGYKHKACDDRSDDDGHDERPRPTVSGLVMFLKMTAANRPMYTNASPVVTFVVKSIVDACFIVFMLLQFYRNIGSLLNISLSGVLNSFSQIL